MTHLHTDHASGLAGFPDAESSLRAPSWFAVGLPGRLRPYVREHALADLVEAHPARAESRSRSGRFRRACA